jgi:hypothetical protein
VEEALRSLREAVDELATFLQALENGVLPSLVSPCRLRLSKPVLKAPLVSVLEATIG